MFALFCRFLLDSELKHVWSSQTGAGVACLAPGTFCPLHAGQKQTERRSVPCTRAHSEEAERRTEAARWRQEGFYCRGSLLARVRLRADDMWERWEGGFHWTDCLFTSTAPIPWCHWVGGEIITPALTGCDWHTLKHRDSEFMQMFCQVQVLEGNLDYSGSDEGSRWLLNWALFFSSSTVTADLY